MVENIGHLAKELDRPEVRAQLAKSLAPALKDVAEGNVGFRDVNWMYSTLEAAELINLKDGSEKYRLTPKGQEIHDLLDYR